MYAKTNAEKQARRKAELIWGRPLTDEEWQEEWERTTRRVAVAQQAVAKRESQPAPQHVERPACHYCGQPATDYGFFDEPICRECGGRR